MGSILLDKYEIVRVIGRGGMGMVYEAREIGTERRVAIKWMHAQSFAAKAPELLRFQQEARIAGSLDSPHVTVVYECAREPEKDVVFQVMELLDGEDLRALIDRVGALEPSVALRIATQACAGLSAAHEAGVVHRDIKPENIFLARVGEGKVIVKLLDFGIAKIRGPRDSEPGMTVPANSMTASGEMLGTPLYMAPEQFEGAKHVDARCDVYSMGVTLYALLAGGPPYGHLKSFMQILRAIMTERPPSLLQRAPWVRSEIVTVVEKAMQADRNARYANATDMLAALQALVHEQTPLHEEMLVGITPEQKGALTKPSNAEALAETVVQTHGAPEAKMPWWKRIWGK